MKKKTRLAFLWNFEKAPEIYPYWRDGLRAAVEEIGRDNDVDIYLGEDCHSIDAGYDAILFWSDSSDPIVDIYSDYKAKKGIILTSDLGLNPTHLRSYDVIFCESKPVADVVRAHGLKAVQCFGTDTDFYTTPPKGTEKDIEYFYPATFSPWKKQGDIATLGEKLWCVGTVQPDGQAEHDECAKNGVNIAVGYFKAEHIRDLYHRAQKVIIPAIHGSERTVLESLACGIIPDVTNPANVRTRSYLEEYKKSGLSPREFVVKNYSHTKYGDTIKKHLA